MAHCEVMALPAGVGGERVELLAAPAHEPLASCAFEWARDWQVHTVDWAPPPLYQLSDLFGLVGGQGDSLRVQVARFGLEVDGLAFLRAHLGLSSGGAAGGSADVKSGWRGLPVAFVDDAEASRRVVHAGPALHLLTATGAARRLVDRAASTLRSLSGRPPHAEPTTVFELGPVRARRLASWTAEVQPGQPHGHARLHLRVLTSRGDLEGYLRIWVVDRRVHPGLDPAELVAGAQAAHAFEGLETGVSFVDPGAGGPAHGWRGRWRDVPVELRQAIRQVGPALVIVDGAWPSPEHAPVAWMHGRRHFDVLLATLSAPS